MVSQHSLNFVFLDLIQNNMINHFCLLDKVQYVDDIDVKEEVNGIFTWIIDNDIPIFTGENRNYIENLL